MVIAVGRGMIVLAAVLAGPFGPMAAATEAAGSAAAPAKTPITHEALWMMKRVGLPVVSPDGKWVVYPVWNLLMMRTKPSAISGWYRSMDEEPPRRITNTKAPESDVAWSADSSSIAFSTKRESDEVEQIYILNLAEGGEARRLTSISTGAKQPAMASRRQGDLVRVARLSQRSGR